MPMVITYQRPDISPRGLAKAMRVGMTAAFAAHRVHALPWHFRMEAYQRYPDAYKAPALTAKRKSWQLRYLTMTPAERASYWKERAEYRKLRRGTRNRRENPDQALPLVETGHLRRMVLLTAPLTVTVRPNSARARFAGLPWYLGLSQPGQTNKVRALQAVIEPEAVAFARAVDQALQTHLNTLETSRA